MTKFKGTLVLRNNISYRHGKNGFMPSQPKIDLKIDPAKRRSQISRRVDNSFPVFAPLVWHAGHADGELVWLPSVPGMKLACPARLIFMERQHCHMPSDEHYMHSGHHYI